MQSNIIDIPRKAGAPDLLGVDNYMKALIQFIESCQMPTTIAIQGEWGSGKTSMLNQIRFQLCESGMNTNGDKALPYYGIWINTWQYSLMKSKEETLMAILAGLTHEVTKIVEGKHLTQSQAAVKKVKSIFSKIAKAGAKAAISHVGLEDDLIDSVLDSGNDNVDLLTFKSSLQEAIEKCLELDLKEGNNNRGFIFFIDDLDRIDPPVAVEILELIKNIFEVNHCIFVLAIDYEVVVKGLIPKFGALTEKNEREFRSFFDKIIQLPFSMPVAMYDVNHFLIESLHNIGYLKKDSSSESIQDKYAEFALLSVGTNPRSLKRLINTLSLLHIIGSQKEEDSNKQNENENESLINFGLVCIQIAYPKIYQAVLEEPDFKKWNEKTAKRLRLPEISELQLINLKDNTEFDEDWELVVYRIAQQEIFLSSRAFQISQLLNFIAETVPSQEDFGNYIARIIGFSTVTSVSLDFIPKLTKKGNRVRFDNWEGYASMLSENKALIPLIPELKLINDYFKSTYDKEILINYTPNFMTIAVANALSRSKTVLFIRLTNKGVLQFEYSGKTAAVKTLADFTIAIQEEIKQRFNELSSVKK